jgi:hypothetical protein
MDKRYVVSLGNLVPVVKGTIGYVALERRCTNALSKKVPQYSFRLFPLIQLKLVRPKQDCKEYCLQFIDLPDSKLANVVQQSGLFVSCDDSIVKFQVGPIPLLTTQEELDAKVASLFPGVPITTEVREDKSTGRPRGNAWISVPRSLTSKLFEWQFWSDEDKAAGRKQLHYRKSLPPKLDYCRKCWKVGHLAPSCSAATRCGWCHGEGHSHLTCSVGVHGPCLICKNDAHGSPQCPQIQFDLKLYSPVHCDCVSCSSDRRPKQIQRRVLQQVNAPYRPAAGSYAAAAAGVGELKAQSDIIAQFTSLVSSFQAQTEQRMDQMMKLFAAATSRQDITDRLLERLISRLDRLDPSSDRSSSPQRSGRDHHRRSPSPSRSPPRKRKSSRGRPSTPERSPRHRQQSPDRDQEMSAHPSRSASPTAVSTPPSKSLQSPAPSSAGSLSLAASAGSQAAVSPSLTTPNAFAALAPMMSSGKPSSPSRPPGPAVNPAPSSAPSIGQKQASAARNLSKSLAPPTRLPVKNAAKRS